MEKTDKSISTGQLILIFFVINICEKFLTVPILLLKICGRGAVFSLAIFLLFDFLMLVAMLVIHNVAKEMTFFEFIEKRLGKVLSKIVLISLVLYMFVKIMVLESYLQNFLSQSLFDGIIWSVFLLPAIILYAVMAMRTIKSIGRVGEIFSWFITFALIILIVLVFNNVDTVRLLPIEVFSPSSLKGLLMLPAWFGDYILLLFFMGKVKRSPRFNRTMIIGGAISLIVIFAMLCFVFSAYIDIIHFIDYGKKISSITQISINHLNYGRIDLLLYSVTMISILLFSGIYFFCLVRSTENLLNKKEPQKKYAVVLAIIIYILSITVFAREQINYQFLANIANYFMWGMHIVLPILLLTAAFIGIRKDKKHTQNKLLAKCDISVSINSSDESSSVTNTSNAYGNAHVTQSASTTSVNNRINYLDSNVKSNERGRYDE